MSVRRLKIKLSGFKLMRLFKILMSLLMLGKDLINTTGSFYSAQLYLFLVNEVSLDFSSLVEYIFVILISLPLPV